MALQFESNMQNLVYQMDEGSGRKVVQMVLFALFAFAVASLYTFTNFQGLNNARAMDEAQLARNLALHGHFTTQTVRPVSLGLLAERSRDGTAPVLAHPDLFHPPLWPAMLALVFRATGIPQTGVPTTDQVYAWDYVPVAFSHFFTILSALWVWLIGGKLFDRRVASLSAGAFLVSDMIWRNSVQGGGLSAAMCFSLAAVYCALWAAERPANLSPEDGEGPAWRWIIPLVLAAGFMAAAFLSRYAAGNLAVAIFLFLGFSRRRRAWSIAFLFVLLASLPVVPWMLRNRALSGNPFGLVFLDMLSGTYLFPGDALFRTLRPSLPDLASSLYAVQIKMMANLRLFFANGFGLAGGGLLLSLAGAMFFHRFVRPASRILRWCLIPAAVLMVLFATAFGADSLPALLLFWPLAIPYAWAFFLVLMDRLQFELRFFAAGVMSIVLFLTALPMLINVLPPRTGLPYPPYFHRYIGWMSTMLEPEECLVTDIPWATAWYGGSTSILLPRTIDGFYEINNEFKPIPMAYFTTVTRDKPWVRALADPTAPEHSWYQVFAGGRVPGDFPLGHGRFIGGSDQLILADRPRW